MFDMAHVIYTLHVILESISSKVSLLIIITFRDHLSLLMSLCQAEDV